jgi:hypothetical protein
MSPFSEREDKGNPTEHLRVGVSLFMAQQEDKVRQKNAEIDRLKMQAENAWSEFIGDRLNGLLGLATEKGFAIAKWWIWIGSILSFVLGLGVEHYGKW